MSSAMERTVYVLAGEYSAPPEEAAPVSVFEKARATPHAGRALEDMMVQAGERAILALNLGDAGRLSVDRLLLTTMPDVGGTAITHAINLPNVLKRRLGLSESCQARFEIGSSDAGASLFASAVHLLKGLDDPGTAIVIAGQVMPGGREAIATVSQVLDRAERESGLTMIAVGDLLMDLEAWLYEADRERADDRLGGTGPTFEAAIEEIVRTKLLLAVEYPSAQRRGLTSPATAARVSRHMTDWHLAWASNGACAVVLTTDEALVREWLSQGGRRRVVRVLGVGEGDADPRLSMRGEPFVFFKSLRQALVSLRRNTDTNHDFLRSSAFTVLHDAFPSIEQAFLLGLGFSPVEAARRARSYWPNPYGGLTTFGHALAASGLVQIAKAFHVFTRPAAYVPVRGGEEQPDFTRATIPLHCLTTSVGGPLSHVVATLLQSCAVDVETQTSSASPGSGGQVTHPPLLGPFRPRRRHQRDEPLVKDFDAKIRWICRLARRYREATAEASAHLLGVQSPALGLAVVEARTHFDARLVPLPLPEDFVSRHVVPETAPADGLSASSVDELRDRVRAFAASRSGRPSEGVERIERDAYAGLRLPVALVTGDLPHLPDAEQVRSFVYVPEDVGDVGIGDLVVIASGASGASGATVLRVLPADVAPALVPLWYRTLQAQAASSPGDWDPDATFLAQASGGEPRQTTTRALLKVLVDAPLNPAIMGALQALGTLVVEDCLRVVARVPTNGAVALLHELVLQPEPNRDRLATALRGLCGLDDGQPETPVERLAYCEFELLEPTQGETTAHLVSRFSILSGLIRRAEGWLAGSEVTHGRVGLAFAVTVRAPTDDLPFWRSILRFARDVQRGARIAGVDLRSAVCVGGGVAFSEVFGRFGAAGDVQKAVNRAVGGSAGGQREGLAVVVLGQADEETALALSERLWRDSGPDDESQRVEAGPVFGMGKGVYYDLRRC